MITKLLPLAMVLSAGLWAQALELSVGGGVQRFSNRELGSSGATRYNLTDGWRINFRTTANSGRFTAHEFGYAYNRTNLQSQDGTLVNGPISQSGMAIHQGFYNYLLYATPEGSRIRPFAAGGVHFANYVPPGASATQGGGSTKFGVNYGGGLKVRVAENWMIRLDGRQYINPRPFGNVIVTPGKWYNMTEISVGVAFVL